MECHRRWKFWIKNQVWGLHKCWQWHTPGRPGGL